MLLSPAKLLQTVTVVLCFYHQIIFASFSPLVDFGDNPGEISASLYATQPSSDGLVVLLHGCVQQGEQLAKQSGFVDLAHAHKFALLVPQQSERNNIKGCFNWFSEQDILSNSGESLSLKNMILHAKNKLNASQVYITGLSAGGAMASVMLVNYPELFDAGAVISGVPYPCANNLTKAISCMRIGPTQLSNELTEQVRALNNYQGPWPSMSVWTGSQDKVVNPKNSQSLAEHWAQLIGLPANKKMELNQGYRVTRWGSTDDSKVELLEIDNMTHGMAVNPAIEHGGSVAPFLLKSPLSTAKSLINFWGLDKY
ncbi:extracellular catalytic domain type 1 short-chain-length polyhydroxyalkanoate depolymerase [Thalassotalea atypica]|uniref:extracellular catalytic domain type 1 short-chain-length polyhydroxyalkanoate depolymerase n=1 Tax=Thalassotalea atypica TaxID=2054316 RepID=UPI00257294BC|nr:PHB depolymerase family esterase [Thalassotalea atypica]